MEEHNSTECLSLIQNTVTAHPCLNLNIEEADVRIIPHAIQAVDFGTKRVVVLSSETDVAVFTIYFWHTLKIHGLQELWMRAGVGDSTRYIPLRVIAEKNRDLSTVLPAAHVLTGCDTKSKFGTKHSALKAAPAKYLSKFGHPVTGPDLDDSIELAEKYLVQVLKRNTQCSTMDELRYVSSEQSRLHP